MSNLDTALTVLKSIKSGVIDLDLFTKEAIWWWNGGLEFKVTEFGDVLAGLGEQTVAGIEVIPFHSGETGETVFIEATSDSALKDGRRYQNRYAFIFKFDGTLIKKVSEYSDTAHVMDCFQLG